MLGGDLVVIEAVDRPHVVGSPDPHPVLRRLHAAVQLVERQYSKGALFRPVQQAWSSAPGPHGLGIGGGDAVHDVLRGRAQARRYVIGQLLRISLLDG
ncbi:hypothetical protein GCM10022285_66630 [Streptomyces tunisiensis]|uniref:Uncharacterized protein n=1 Tax=Streptomyces tunisiensis TaxID=948699 RepID=A0ABP7ZD99_9ACTN